MSSGRKTAVVAGAFFIIAAVTAVIGLALYGPVLHDTHYVLRASGGDGRVLAGAVRDVRIGKSGFERFVANAADNWSLTYGLFAVAVSLLLGWAAALIFRR